MTAGNGSSQRPHENIMVLHLYAVSQGKYLVYEIISTMKTVAEEESSKRAWKSSHCFSVLSRPVLDTLDALRSCGIWEFLECRHSARGRPEGFCLGGFCPFPASDGAHKIEIYLTFYEN